MDDPAIPFLPKRVTGFNNEIKGFGNERLTKTSDFPHADKRRSGCGIIKFFLTVCGQKTDEPVRKPEPGNDSPAPAFITFS
jgi:hypothetical protein